MTPDAVVLIVEDEALIAEVVCENLKDGGYAVEMVDNAADAIARIEGETATIQALITDVRLGDTMNGWDIARRARELVSDLPVIYMTGDSGADWSAQGVPNSVLIVKPFATGQVVTAVSTLLNEVAARRATSPSAE
jgi:DNA-binding response OmpR family regulator